jgi:hypothetical protein
MDRSSCLVDQASTMQSDEAKSNAFGAQVPGKSSLAPGGEEGA